MIHSIASDKKKIDAGALPDDKKLDRITKNWRHSQKTSHQPIC